MIFQQGECDREMNVKKLLTVGITLLFIGIAYAPSITANNPILTKTIYVDDDNTQGPWDGSQEHPYQHIQDGIDNASDGDTVLVYSGTYYENVVVDKAVTLISENRDTTIIDGERIGDVINITAYCVTIMGFTVRNGGENWYWYGGAGIKVYHADHIEISNCNASSNTNGIFLYSSSNNAITNNTANNNWEGFF